MSALPDTAVCLHCGYALRGLPDNTCPECGRGFDRADPRTYFENSTNSTMVNMARRYAFPPPLWHSVLSIAATLLALIWMAVSLWPFLPHYGYYDFLGYSLPALFLGPALLFPLTVSFLARWLSCRRFQRWAHRPFRRASWYVLPACVLALVAATLYPWPTQVAFLVSRPWIGRAVAEMSPGQVVRKRQCFGLFPTALVVADAPGRVVFRTRGPWYFDLTCDSRLKAESPRYAVQLAPSWYIWSRRVPLYNRWPDATTTRVFPENPLLEFILESVWFRNSLKRELSG